MTDAIRSAGLVKTFGATRALDGVTSTCGPTYGGEAIDLLGALRGRLDRGRRDMLIERFQLDPRVQERSG